jgi:predicted nucleotidyltransferase
MTSDRTSPSSSDIPAVQTDPVSMGVYDQSRTDCVPPPHDIDMDVPDRSKEVDCNSLSDDFAFTHRRLGQFFNCFANGGTAVFVHGSFARGVATSRSDINLYVAPYSRSELDILWNRSGWRYGSTDTMEASLEEWLRRPVTISCKDDPRFWVNQEPMTMVFPLYEDQLPKIARVGELPYLENLLRKCWYEVSWKDLCSKRPEICCPAVNPLDGATLNSFASSKKRTFDAAPDLLISAILKLDSILQSASKEDWELIQQQFPSILSLREEIANLAQLVAGMTQNGQPREWSEMEERYRSCAAEILKMENFIETDTLG